MPLPCSVGRTLNREWIIAIKLARWASAHACAFKLYIRACHVRYDLEKRIFDFNIILLFYHASVPYSARATRISALIVASVRVAKCESSEREISKISKLLFTSLTLAYCLNGMKCKLCMLELNLQQCWLWTNVAVYAIQHGSCELDHLQ